MWLTTVEVLGNPLFAVFYISTMLILGFHLWHAISSAFQTMGINHHKWTPIIDKLAIVYCVVVACGFGATAVGSFAVMNFDEKAKAIMEQAKNPSYQEALEILKQQPLEEQRKKAHIISKFPERANLIVESIMERRGPFGGEKSEDFMKFKEKLKKKKLRQGDEGPQSEEDSEGDEL